MGEELRNWLDVEALLRRIGRGGMLDKTRGETGLQQRITVGQQVDLLQLSSENRANPCVVTLCIDVKEEVPGGALAEVALLQTVLTWGTGKGNQSAIVDTRVGSQLVLAANILNVAVRYVAQPRLLSDTVFLVAASVAYGDRPGSGNPALTFTDELLTIADAGVSAPRQIPQYAVAVQYQPRTAPGPNAVIRFLGTGGGSGVVVSELNPAPGVFVPIPNGAYFVELRNITGGGGNNNFRLLYEVVL